MPSETFTLQKIIQTDSLWTQKEKPPGKVAFSKGKSVGELLNQGNRVRKTTETKFVLLV